MPVVAGVEVRVNPAPLDLVMVTVRAAAAARLQPGAPPIILILDAPAPVPVRGDEARLEQIVANLLTNAITYAPHSARINVRVRMEGEQAVLQVRDDGPGIPAAALPHLFSRFYQVTRADAPSRQGLGLGLYLIRELATAHGGTVDVASSEGAGATFTVTLPLGTDGG